MNIQFEESRRLKARFLLHMKKDKINIYITIEAVGRYPA